MSTLVINSLLAIGNDVCRVLWFSEEFDLVYLISINDSNWPYNLSCIDLMCELDAGIIKFVEEDSMMLVVEEEEIKYSSKKIRDKYFGIINELYKMISEPNIYTFERVEYIKHLAKKYNLSRNSIDVYFKRYLKGGRTKNSLLPRYYKCGARGRERVLGVKKVGRPSIYNEARGINVSQENKRIFKKSINKFYNNYNKNSLKATYELMIKEYFSESDINSKDLRIKNVSRIPTLNQFRYWFNKERDLKVEISKRYGARVFEQKHRAILNSANNGILGPGMEYAIDATIGDIYLVSQYNKEWIIGRPVIYMVIDTFSRMITGFYIGLEGPNWIGAATALYNSMTSKIEFCREYDIDIQEKDWPCYHVPFSILADRGELEGFSADNLVNNLNVVVKNTSPYRAEWKSVVEQNFRVLNLMIKGLVPGAIQKDFRQRGAKDYRLEAKLNIKEFTRIIINYIVHHNNNCVLKHYKLEPDMIADGVEPIPIKIWNWGIKNRSGILKALSEETLKYSLMPRDYGTITEKGIRFKGVYYSSLKAIKERLFEKARLNGKYKIKVIYDPRNLNNIYWVLDDVGKYEKCFLLNREYRYLNMTVDEVQYLKMKEMEKVNELEREELEHKINFIQNIEEIVEVAENETSNRLENKDLKGIRTNRAAEKILNKKEEAFILENGSKSQKHNENKDTESVEISDLDLLKRKLRSMNSD
ncbi:Mu transposase C-terminal domain-containing protein [Clostridium sp. SHJSY1]|uniref:Mu transposase C-terminal domain-containing protein n=1 Tax=Clostridium sp. SHJSY1 TaxID=2942483 RepID=UPI002874138E|nr:Mu transposase C-terminal domain-containing protein [Clostridium sp. SHJSY1]MDS0527608.1 Mu transposase C-terminal domain-containing protein [Clostridium sp. SHJSY1]